MSDGLTIKGRELSYKNVEDVRDVKGMGIYPYFREISDNYDNVVTIEGLSKDGSHPLQHGVHVKSRKRFDRCSGPQRA